MTGTPSETARLCPYLVNDTNRLASESSVLPRKKLESDGAATPRTIISIAITSISSIRVKPDRTLTSFRLPVRNVIFGSCPAIRSHRHQIVRAWIMLSGTFVNVGVLPGIIGNVALQIRSTPILCVSRRLHQVHQPMFSFAFVTVTQCQAVDQGRIIGILLLCRPRSGLLREC